MGINKILRGSLLSSILAAFLFIAGCSTSKDTISNTECGIILAPKEGINTGEIHLTIFNVLSLEKDTITSVSLRDVPDTLILPIKDEIYLSLEHKNGNNQFLVRPEQFITITFEKDKITFGGENSDLNNYLFWLQKLRETSPLFSPDVELDSLQKNISTLEREYSEKLNNMPEMSDNIKEILNMFNDIELINLRQTHAWNSLMAAGPPATPTELSSNEFHPTLLKQRYFPYLNLLHVEVFMKYFIPYMWNPELQDKRDSLPALIEIDINKSHQLTTELKEYYKAKNIDHWIAMYGLTNNMETMFNRFASTYSNSDFIEPIKSHLNKWKLLQPGRKAPELWGVNIDGDSIRLSDMLGKTVYINTWATWCAPCIKEIPYISKLEAAYDKSNVKIISISVDKDFDKWKNYVLENNLNSMHHFWNDGMIFSDYSINYLPRYMIVDSSGHIKELKAQPPSRVNFNPYLNN